MICSLRNSTPVPPTAMLAPSQPRQPTCSFKNSTAMGRIITGDSEQIVCAPHRQPIERNQRHSRRPSTDQRPRPKSVNNTPSPTRCFIDMPFASTGPGCSAPLPAPIPSHQAPMPPNQAHPPPRSARAWDAAPIETAAQGTMPAVPATMRTSVASCGPRYCSSGTIPCPMPILLSRHPSRLKARREGCEDQPRPHMRRSRRLIGLPSAQDDHRHPPTIMAIPKRDATLSVSPTKTSPRTSAQIGEVVIIRSARLGRCTQRP
jgi:hypothetical protein